MLAAKSGSSVLDRLPETSIFDVVGGSTNDDTYVMFRHGGILSFRRLSSRLLELKTGRARVLVKHTDRIEREFVKVFASELN